MQAVQAADARVKPASEEDWPTEYLDAIIAAKVVDGVDAAIEHIGRYGSQHTDAIVTDDKAAAEKFLREVDSAIVLHNASTQFADGGEFGFGAEIGIATGRFHARGPVGAEQLTTFKYRVRGTGRSGRDATSTSSIFLSPPRGNGLMPASYVRLPPHAPGLKIGLFGGTFDPPHDAHRAACLIAMKRLDLDRVWWLVTPGNPLKDTRGLAPLEERIAAARALGRHPRIDVTGIEAQIGARYTYDTLIYLRAHCPARAFRLDHGCRQSAQLSPLGELARDRIAGAHGRGRPPRAQPLRLVRRRAGRHWRAPAFRKRQARSLPYRRPPAWVYLHGLKSPLSSTALRAARIGRQPGTSAAVTRVRDRHPADLEPV